MYVAKTHQCKLSGVDLDGFNLFKMFKGVYGPEGEFEFHTQRLPSEWIKLARYLRSFYNQRDKEPTQ